MAAPARKDVTILAPAAIAGVRDLSSVKANCSPAEYIQELEKAYGEALTRAQNDQLALNTFTNIVASFVKIASEQMGRADRRRGGQQAELEVMLPRKTVDLMDGSKVTVSEVPGTRDVIVRIREGVPHPLWEGRHG